MGDGITTMVDFERKFAEEEGDTFELMHEFEVPNLKYETEETEDDNWAVMRAIDDAFWKGWFKAQEEYEDE